MKFNGLDDDLDGITDEVELLNESISNY